MQPYVWTTKAQTTDWQEIGKRCVDRWCQGQTSRPQTCTSDTIAALHYIFQPYRDPGGRHNAQEDTNDMQPPPHMNSKGCCGCSGAATKRGNYKNIDTPGQCCFLQSRAIRAIFRYLQRETLQALRTPPSLQPDKRYVNICFSFSLSFLFSFFFFFCCSCWKLALQGEKCFIACFIFICFSNSRSCKSNAFTTLCHNLFGESQRLPDMA